MVAPIVGEDEELPEPEAGRKRPPWWRRLLGWAARLGQDAADAVRARRG